MHKWLVCGLLILWYVLDILTSGQSNGIPDLFENINSMSFCKLILFIIFYSLKISDIRQGKRRVRGKNQEKKILKNGGKW